MCERKRKIKEQKEKSPFKQEVNLVAVTKTRTIEEIKEVLDYGIYDLGENRVKELLEKQAILTDENIKWHLLFKNSAAHPLRMLLG